MSDKKHPPSQYVVPPLPDPSRESTLTRRKTEDRQAFISEAEAEQIWETFATLVDSATAMESLLADVLQALAATDPVSIAALRDQAAAFAQRCIDGTTPIENGERLLGMWQTRWDILNQAMTAAGYPYESAEVIDIAEHPSHRRTTVH